MRDDALTADTADLLTVTEAAEQVGVSRSTIGSWVTRGLLPAVRIAGRRFIQPADLTVTQTSSTPRTWCPPGETTSGVPGSGCGRCGRRWG
jgi:excisionase family DNA binding protein